MRILDFRSENFKRLQVVEIKPDGNLIQITGANAQGKSSVIEAIWSTFGGKDAQPELPIHKGKSNARNIITVGDKNGAKLVIERKYTEKDSYLTVKGADGGKYSKPQQLIDGMLGAIAFDPLAFMRMDGKEQFNLLRKIVPLDVDVDALNRLRQTHFEARTALNRSIKSAEARVEAITVPDLPDEEPNIDDMVYALSRADEVNSKAKDQLDHLHALEGEIETEHGKLEEMLAAVEVKRKFIKDLGDEHQLRLDEPKIERVDTAAFLTLIEQSKPIVAGFRLQEQKIAAQADLTTLQRESEDLTTAIDKIDTDKAAALAKAKMPIDGLSFDDGTVTFGGLPLTQASGAEQLQVSTAIGATLNPELRVLLIRDGNGLDKAHLAALAGFAEQHDMQIFMERVDETGEVGVVIEDGHVKGQEELVAAFLKEEAEGAKPEKDAQKATAAPPDPERLARATAFLQSQLSALSAAANVRAADKVDATVRAKLANFPELIASGWNAAYDARVEFLRGA